MSNETAEQWVVRFETKDGMYTSVRIGHKEGPTIPRWKVALVAADHLHASRHWLKSVDEIYPVEQARATGGVT